MTATCVLALARLLQTSADGASPPLLRLPGEKIHFVVRAVWRFLADPNGRIQHTAAFLWVQLQSLWLEGCAAVLAAELDGCLNE